MARHFPGGLETREHCSYLQDSVDSYRPISLLPFNTKVLEPCVLAGLRDHISHLISREQHGFLAGRSCMKQLTSVLHYIGGKLDAGKQTDIIYLNTSKAFDKVDQAKLLERLHQYSITGKLHDWFRSYLQECEQQVTVLGSTSRELPITSGVLQGSLLGPIFFLLFVDDLQKLLRHQELPVTPMTPRFVRASILSQTVMPCNPTLMTLSAGPNLLGSYLISPRVNTSASPAKEHP